MPIRGLCIRMVSGSSIIRAAGGILTNNHRGGLYVAPAVPGPYDLIAGGQVDGNQIRNAIDAGPTFVQIHDWNHYESEFINADWEKAYVTRLSIGIDIYGIVVMSNPFARMQSSSTGWAKSSVTLRVSTLHG
jgi:hypothetical protein